MGWPLGLRLPQLQPGRGWPLRLRFPQLQPSGGWPLGLRFPQLQLCGGWPIGLRFPQLQPCGGWPLGLRFPQLQPGGGWPLGLRFPPLQPAWASVSSSTGGGDCAHAPRGCRSGSRHTWTPSSPCSFAKLWPVLHDPMDCTSSGFPVLHHLPEFARTHVH